MPKLPTVRAITQGERELRDWHRNLRIGAATAGFGMMLASLYQLHWAGTLIGFPTFAAAAMAGSLELLLAFNAGAVTTIRRRTDGHEGGYYWSLWGIFGFLLCISIAANVGHCLVALSQWFASGAAPAVLVEHQVYAYVVGAAVAAMVPLGGSFGLHISGFVRKHGAGSDWVDEDGTGALLDPLSPSPATAPRRLAAAVPSARGTATADMPPPSETISPMRPRRKQEDTSAAAAEVPLPPLPAGETEKSQAEDAPQLNESSIVSEEELYAEYKAARNSGEEHRLGPRGDLNPSQLGRRLGQSPQNGRKNVGPRFERRYEAELLAESGNGVDMNGLGPQSGAAPAS